MDYEKKYKNALTKARNIVNSINVGLIGKNSFEAVFPELKKSDDERIRKAIIEFFELQDDNTTYSLIPKKDILDWLEKQGEQKSADKVKPKFEIEEGKWYVCTQTYTLRGKIVVIKGQTYKSNQDGAIEGEDGHLFIDKIDGKALNYFKPWTIKGAKDGDVLSDETTVFIFKDLLSDGSIMSYCDYDTDSGESDAFCPLSVNLMCSKITPSTKEQRDLLFQKMKEVGYEWDAEKKELKKIEQKPAEWSEEDKEMIDNIIDYMTPMPIFFESTKGESGKEYTQEFIIEATNWLKSLRPQSQWKPTKEQINVLNAISNKDTLSEYERGMLCGLYTELKKLTEE